jgi:hypothetical protein
MINSGIVFAAFVADILNLACYVDTPWVTQLQIDKRYNIVYVPYEGHHARKKEKNRQLQYEMRECTIDEY